MFQVELLETNSTETLGTKDLRREVTGLMLPETFHSPIQATAFPWASLRNTVGFMECLNSHPPSTSELLNFQHTTDAGFIHQIQSTPSCLIKTHQA